MFEAAGFQEIAGKVMLMKTLLDDNDAAVLLIAAV